MALVRVTNYGSDVRTYACTKYQINFRRTTWNMDLTPPENIILNQIIEYPKKYQSLSDNEATVFDMEFVLQWGAKSKSGDYFRIGIWNDTTLEEEWSQYDYPQSVVWKRNLKLYNNRTYNVEIYTQSKLIKSAVTPLYWEINKAVETECQENICVTSISGSVEGSPNLGDYVEGSNITVTPPQATVESRRAQVCFGNKTYVIGHAFAHGSYPNRCSVDLDLTKTYNIPGLNPNIQVSGFPSEMKMGEEYIVDVTSDSDGHMSIWGQSRLNVTVISNVNPRRYKVVPTSVGNGRVVFINNASCAYVKEDKDLGCTILKRDQIIIASFDNQPIVGVSSILNVSSDSGLTEFSYIVTPNDVTVAGNSFTFQYTGIFSIEITQSGDAIWNSATTVITVEVIGKVNDIVLTKTSVDVGTTSVIPMALGDKEQSGSLTVVSDNISIIEPEVATMWPTFYVKAKVGGQVNLLLSLSGGKIYRPTSKSFLFKVRHQQQLVVDLSDNLIIGNSYPVEIQSLSGGSRLDSRSFRFLQNQKEFSLQESSCLQNNTESMYLQLVNQVMLIIHLLSYRLQLL